MGCRPALCALLLLVAASIGAHGAAPERGLKATAATAGKVTVRKCNDLPVGSTAAFDQLMGQHEGSKCSDFIKGVTDWNLKSLLRSVSRGKIILCPTNAALQERFMKMGLYKRPFEVPPTAKQAFRTYIRTMVAHPRRIIDAKQGCGNLYFTHKVGVTSRRIGLIPQGSGARKADGELEYQYSVLGQGYNSYVGFPISFGMSSLDPGLTLTPIFQLTPDNVRTLASTGGSCTSQFSTSTYNSASDMKESVSASLSIKGQLSSIAFSASASFNMVSQTSMTSQTITTNSGAKVYLGGYGLAAGPGGLTLEPGFVANCLPLMQAASEDRFDSFALESLVDNYGTHYIKTVWYGGIASVINQLTAQSYSSLSSLGVSVSIAVQASMVQVNADVDYSKTNSESVSSVSSTFSQVLAPSSVPLALTSSKVNDDGSPPSPSFIDCVQWTAALRNAMQDSGWRAPVHYTLAPMAGVFSYPQIFPSDWASVLPAMQRQVYLYQKTCGYSASDFYQWEARVADTPGYTACPTPTYFASCPTGTYLTKTKRCNTCYGDGSVIGPNCNATYTLSCTAFSCYCMPKYADNFDITSTFCTPLSANPPAPPAPSMAELASRKKALK